MEQVKYQAAHHELVASAIATKLAHEIDPENKVGCMLAAGQYYPHTCHPRDVWEGLQEDRENYFFIDVQARGYYPNYAKKKWERAGIEIEMTDEDLALLKEHTVDFISFSYYSSRIVSGDPAVKEKTAGNIFASIKNPYLAASEIPILSRAAVDSPAEAVSSGAAAVRAGRRRRPSSRRHAGGRAGSRPRAARRRSAATGR